MLGRHSKGATPIAMRALSVRCHDVPRVMISRVCQASSAGSTSVPMLTAGSPQCASDSGSQSCR